MKTPNQPTDPRDTRNLLMAIVLSLLVIFGWQVFVEAPRQAQVKAEQAEALARAQAAFPAATSAPTPDGGIPTPAASPAQTREAALAASRRIPVRSDNLHGSISLTGGRLDDLTLARYRETVDPASPEIVLLAPSGTPTPYYVELGWSAEAGTTVRLPDQNTVWQADGTALTPEHPLTLSWNNGQGLTFSKTISIDDKYMFTVKQSVKNESGAPITLHPYGLVARTFDLEATRTYLLHEGPIGVYDNRLAEDSLADLAEDGILTRSTTGGWFGFTDKYWLVALVPDQTAKLATRVFNARQVADNRFQLDFMGEPVTVAAGENTEVTTRLFSGAKEVRVLEAYRDELSLPRFDYAIDFGWFYFLTKPYFHALDLMAGWFGKMGAVGNFGLAILAFTVLIKLALFPLADKSYHSMAKMKALTPKMTELRETYKDDQQRLSQEMMALYKREGINPLSGCWPVLIQIPIFFALYKVLYVSIEMRHAPFYGWIHDLSAADPSNIFTLFGLIEHVPGGLHLGFFPLAMAISMWLQMKMNPPPTDQTQRIVFGLMPWVFMFSMSQFPVGLVMYWTWSNLLSIVQQYIIMRRLHVKVFD
jgi:YidC/Oxa1 family membrane protein insertase